MFKIEAMVHDYYIYKGIWDALIQLWRARESDNLHDLLEYIPLNFAPADCCIVQKFASDIKHEGYYRKLLCMDLAA